ncbi:TonB-dependent receptor [Luteimonas sp. BDR2-5]|uniref:TonB-dependent receptor plug domain-containing protein n=1 Tax=Proluteimonas luteida TaxID=2878685 RepID=UPI001E53B309|nr:TonB-dependent receptor [Luteimonas sp. BDR2-5]MCD9027476.1 TonB-dependent receptor [Luteimonas sp. BDR2-5]
MRPSARRLSLAIACALALPVAAHAAEGAATPDDVFTLGQITVTAERPDAVATGDDVITREEMWTFNTLTLDDAVKLTPGVMTTQDSNGRRNEHDIFVRGFGRWQVPLSIDGVRIYLPADNRLDFRRFLTADLAEVQVRKGYVSVIDGPGAMGGAINLVTRKPTEPFEARFQAGLDLGRDGSHDAWNGYASVGTRQDMFYAQASVSYQDRKHWRLPGDFEGTSIQAPGARDRSASRDSRVNLKFGFVPNASDEYTLSYTRQDGSKGAPLNVYNDPPNPPNSYWDWPMWDIENLYFLSNTRFSDATHLKTKVYYNTFDNALYAYDDASYTTQSNNGRFQSIYGDKGYGASVEFGFRLLPDSDSRVAAHWRSDRHSEYNLNRPTHPTLSSREPTQHNREDTWSLALENTWHASDTVDVLVGVSHDRNDAKQAQEYNETQGLFEYPTGGSDAWNGQAAVYWQQSADSRFGASLSSRTRFATTFERFSTRFGTAVPNPDLSSERGTNLELSWERRMSDDVHFNTAVFYSDVRDMIQTVIVDAGPPQMTQTRNVGDGEYYGAEFGGQARLSDTWVLGGNATWLHRTIKDPLQPEYRPTGVPQYQALLYATWSPLARWSFTPSIEFADDRWNEGPGGAYIRTGQYTLANLQVQWDVRSDVRVAFGGRNLLDEAYELAWGFPEQGRSFYAKLQVGF